ncbi:M23 family metallopeptidase [Caballeronia sp. BR00000012568055]|uniref:M23 family metallopeptidase n=1 Tax=Caballeronia sp. BR00000012568055 TaxID=2918761 RepID=UPI0023F709D2|nr:M23 family metallopeptidase [Caballeronia sp. BR00000012568055]
MGSATSSSKNDLYIVIRRGALRSIVGTACSAVVVALGVGAAAGHFIAPKSRLRYEPVPTPSAAPVAPVAPVASGDVARLQAANASLDARVERLAVQLDKLSGFDQRLRARSSRAITTTVARASSGDAEGGPELPPRPCDAAAGASSNPQGARAELDCISSTIDALEHGVSQHEDAWDAFPGRRPIAYGRTSSSFGNRLDPFSGHPSFHPGVDLVAPTGTPIRAAAKGRVIYAGPMPGYGNAVDIDHGNGYVTRYAHASKIEVRVGQTVQPGEEIAKVGSTGRSTGPHLHFEVRMDGRAVDPAGYLALFGAAAGG